MYIHPTFGTDTNNIIILFNHYLQANLKFYKMYIDASSHFTRQMLLIYF